MGTNLIIILALLFLGLGVLGYFVFQTHARVERLLQGKNAASLEDSFKYIAEEIKRMNANQEITEKTLHNFNSRIRKSLSGFKTIRFNPFPEAGGGNQSFAIAMINEDGDGIIISSLYTREKTSVFAKPIKGGKSEFELTEEEKKALTEAK